jgi:RNA polymerase sigma-70 factor, ECF subfamily
VPEVARPSPSATGQRLADRVLRPRDGGKRPLHPLAPSTERVEGAIVPMVCTQQKSCCDLAPCVADGATRMNAKKKEAHKNVPDGPTVEHDAHEALLEGDSHEVVTILVDGYGDFVLRACVAFLRDKTLADDVFQQVFFEVFTNLNIFQPNKPFLPWIMWITRNRCLDMLNALRRRERHIIPADTIPDVIDPARSSEELLTCERRDAELYLCLGRLPEEMRVVVISHFMLGTSFSDMAADLKGSPAALQVRGSRALERLRRCLRARGVNL